VDADLSKLRVLDAVIKETLRLHGPAPIGSVRYGIVTLAVMHSSLCIKQSDDRNRHEKKSRQGQSGDRDRKRGRGGGGGNAAVTQCMMRSWILGLR
jgi:hypothetical protein